MLLLYGTGIGLNLNKYFDYIDLPNIEPVLTQTVNFLVYRSHTKWALLSAMLVFSPIRMMLRLYTPNISASFEIKFGFWCKLTDIA